MQQQGIFRVYQVLNVVFLRMFEENLRVINKALSKKKIFSFIIREILAVFFLLLLLKEPGGIQYRKSRF